MIKPTIECNHCGECCKAEVCEAGQIIDSKAQPPCPLLIEINDKYLCILIATEFFFNMEPVLQESLGVNKGCTNEVKLHDKTND